EARKDSEKWRGVVVLLGLAFFVIGVGEGSWWGEIFLKGGLNDAPMFVSPRIPAVIAFHIAIFLLFAATPYFCGAQRTWPWVTAALAGPLQFWFVHRFCSMPAGVPPGRPLVPEDWFWLPTLAFALPGAAGVWYLIRRERVGLASGDSPLATQGAAVLAFVSFVFPVQFQREWITLGWAIEGLLLILLFRWIPNRRLRAVALIVLVGAFVRL